MSRHSATAATVLDRPVSRPVIVVDGLSRRRGPSVGIVTLPVALDWTPPQRLRPVPSRSGSFAVSTGPVRSAQRN